MRRLQFKSANHQSLSIANFFVSITIEQGTVIRVFSVLNGQCKFEFRRGYARCVSIYSLCFSEDSLFLAASSNTQTVHIFKLEEPTTDIQ